MTHTPLTKADRDSILAASSADGYYAHAISRLCADLDAAEAERDDAVALIDAAKSDVRPESFLEHAQAILAKCIAPYSCEQMKAVGDALAGCYRKWELMSEVALKAKEDADSMAKCKGCGGTVGDHLAPDQGGCPGSFEIDGVQMVPLAGRDNAVAQRDRAEAERDALKKALRLLDRITDGKESSNGTEPEEIQQVVERFVALKAKLADLSEADEELHTCRALVNATSENLSVDLERMVDDLAEANEKAARSEKDSHSWHDLYEDTKAKLAALVEAAARVRIAEDAYEGSEDQSTDYQEVHRSTTDLWAMLDAAIAAARGGAS